MTQALFELKNVGLEVRREPVSMTRRVTNLVRGVKKSVPNQKLLKNINLTIKSGDRIGLTGPNGAGKSTMLRVLAGIYPVTEGSIEVDCNPYGLFSVSQGILAAANGIDNIYVKCLGLGMSRIEIKRLIPHIVRFSGLGADIYRPVDQYSAGMKLRLSAAISLSVEADFLLLDEWIGAGDKAFSARLDKRLREILESSKGLVIASHSEKLLNRHCSTIIRMNQGELLSSTPILEQSLSRWNHL